LARILFKIFLKVTRFNCDRKPNYNPRGICLVLIRVYPRLSVASLSGIGEDETLELRLWPKIQQQTDFDFRGAEIVEQLGLVQGIEHPASLEFQQDRLGNQQVRPKIANDRCTAKPA
jgi:hypothetical protein